VEEAVLILPPKKTRLEIFQRIFALKKILGGVSGYATTTLIVALSPGHSDITRLRPWSQIATGSHFDQAENFQKFAQITGKFNVFDPRSGISGPLRGELPHA
jgi:hypothetical protein